jgi:hypothetical protein
MILGDDFAFSETSLRGVGIVILSKIDLTDESLSVTAAGDDRAIRRVCNCFCKVSLNCHAALAMTGSVVAQGSFDKDRV